MIRINEALSSRSVRFLCLGLLLFFLFVCGVHIAGSHHDSPHVLAVVANVLFLLVLVAAALALSSLAIPAPWFDSATASPTSQSQSPHQLSSEWEFPSRR